MGGFSSQGASLACLLCQQYVQWILQIDFWCNTCWSPNDMGAEPFVIHILVHVSRTMLGFEPTIKHAVAQRDYRSSHYFWAGTLNLIRTSGRSRISQTGGANDKGGINQLFGHFFRKMHENGEILVEGSSSLHPLGSTNGTFI